MTTTGASPELGAQPQSSSSQGKGQRSGEPSLLWLANLTGADIGLPPLPQDPDDRCTIWENLVSLVDFESPGFPLTSEELCDYIDIPRALASSSASSAAAGTATPPQAVTLSPPPAEDIDYKTNPHVRPPYSYATLISMAMEASHKPKLTLADICKWIRDNFSYFRRAHPSWQSSIRHNLCINKRFVKVPRDKGEPGRGAYWKLHPQYAERLKTSGSEGRKAPPEQTPPVSGRRAQQEARRAPGSPACSPFSGLEVGEELQRLLQEFEEFESSHNCEPVEGQECPQPCPMPEGQQWAQLCPMPEGQQWAQLCPMAEEQQFSQLCPMAEEQQFSQLCPMAEEQQFSQLCPVPEEQQFSQPCTIPEEQQWAQPCPMPEGQQWAQPCPMPEGQQFPQPGPNPPAEVSALPGAAPGNPAEPGGLTELKSSDDWEAYFSPYLEGDFSTLDRLELPTFSPPDSLPAGTAREQGRPQGEQQSRPEPSLTKAGSDGARAASALLEAAWNEEIENLSSLFPLEQGDDDLLPSLSSTDLLDWDSVDPFKPLLDMGDGINLDWFE